MKKTKKESNKNPIEELRALIESEDYSKALNELATVDIDAQDQAAELYNLKGVALAKQGLLAEAEQALMRAVRIDAGFSQAYYNLGWLYYQRHDYERALAFYKEALLLTGDDAEIYEMMAECAVALQREEDARAFYDVALQLKPDSLNVAVGLAQLHLRHRDTEKAEQVLKVALVSHPDVPELHMTVGLIQKDHGQYEHAIAHFRRVVVIDEYNSQAFNELGECCMAIGLIKQAEPFFAKAAKLDPMNLKAIANLGRLYYQKKDYQKSAIILQQWLSGVRSQVESQGEDLADQRQHLETINMLGTSYYKLKDYDRSRETFQLSMQIEKDQPEVEQMMDKIETHSYRKVSFSLN